MDSKSSLTRLSIKCCISFPKLVTQRRFGLWHILHGPLAMAFVHIPWNQRQPNQYPRHLGLRSIHLQIDENFTKTQPPISHTGRSVPEETAFDQWCQRTAWHGILEFHLTKNAFVKVMWALVILFCVCMTVNQCLSLVLDYAVNVQWVTSVTYEPQPEGFVEWPNLKVCDMNPVFESQLIALGVDNPYLVAHVYHPDPDSIAFYDEYQAAQKYFVDGRTIEGMKGSLDNLYKPYVEGKSLKEIMDILFVQCNRSVIHCGTTVSFDLRKRVANDCGCNQTLAATTSPAPTFTCYFINSSLALNKTFRVGRESSVYFLFDPRVPDYYRNILLYRVPSAGLSIQLLYGDPFFATHTELVMGPGTHVTVSLVRQRHRINEWRMQTIQLSSINKPCNDTYDYSYVNLKNYSAMLCALDCMLGSSMRMCGCNVMQLATVPTKKIKECSGQSVIDCWAELTRRLQLQLGANNGSITDDLKRQNECVQDCKEACEYDVVDMRTSTAVFPAPTKVAAFTTYLNRAFAGTDSAFTEERTRQLIFFEMFYEVKEIRVIEKSPRITVAEFISNVGGALGVWTGLSIMSLYQCMIYAGKGMFNMKRRNGGGPSWK